MTKIPDSAFAHHTIVLGKTRAGKSSTMRGFVERLLEQKKPVGIIDPKGDWWGLKSSRDGTKPGFKVVIFGGEHADVPIDEHSGKHVAELVATGNRPFIIDLGGWMVGARTRFFIDFASTLFRLTKGPRWLVIDEVHNFAPQGKVHDPDAGKMLHWANRLASEGAGKGITLISASQRPQKVHKDYVTSHETLIAMRVIHPLDRGAVKEWLDGAPGDGVGKEVLDTLATLKRGEAWVWSPEIGFGPIRMQFPMFKTFDSFAAPTTETTEQLVGWAAVDLEDVRAKLADVVEKAKADDPKALKARILELEKAARQPQPSEAQERELEILRGRVATLQAQADKFMPLIATIGPALEDALLKLERVTDAAKAAEKVIVDEHNRLRAAAERTIDLDLNQMSRGPIDAAIAAGETAGPRPKPMPRVPLEPRRIDIPASTEGMTPARQLILDKVAWAGVFFNCGDVERVVLGFLVGKHKKTKSFVNDLGGLRSAGMIEYLAGERVMLTDAGRAIAADPGRPTRDQLLDGVRSALPPKEWEILNYLLGYSTPTPRQEIADHFDVHIKTKTFVNALGHLRGLGLIYYSGGDVGVADFLKER